MSILECPGCTRRDTSKHCVNAGCPWRVCEYQHTFVYGQRVPPKNSKGHIVFDQRGHFYWR